ncbi:MAG: PEP-CTERM sorting domain-containing protein [Planctomycetaceae bacterium]|nr:PEP-CTERM sorting domain-containing protein [Planctomycetaceae bacterium]
MKKVCFSVVLVLSTSVDLFGGLMTYTSRSQFQSLAPGLTMQDFAVARVMNGADALVTGPLNQFTDNAIFKPNEIKPGLTISSSGSTAVGNQIYVAGVNTIGNSAKSIYTNGSNATMRLDFQAVSAVGLGLIGFTNGNPPRAFNLTVLTNMGTRNFTTPSIPTAGPGFFYGFIASGGEVINSISFQSGGGANEGLANLEYGNLPATTTPVPEPTSFAIFGLGLAGFGAVRYRRRKKLAAE